MIQYNQARIKGGFNMTVKELAKAANCSQARVYQMARTLGRKPTVDELLQRKGKCGRPAMYFKQDENK